MKDSIKSMSAWKKALWFVAIWTLSVLTLATIAFAIRFVLGMG